jgi:glutathione reductase (NADPH)
MTKQYDLVVIGTGTAAQVASFQIRAAGWSVAVIDFRPFGGTCALRGCDPKKVLVGGAETVEMARRMSGRGVDGDVQVDWPDLIAFKRTFTVPVPPTLEKLYAETGIDAYHGQARFLDRDILRVDGETLKSRYFLIASGARPAPLGFPGEEHLLTNEEFLELEALPKRIVLVGGGYIAAEFSHIGARAGATVTVLQRAKRMLKTFDPDLVGWWMEKFAELGVDVRTGTAVEAVEKKDSGFIVKARSQDGPVAVDADIILHAGGRIPDIDSLNLDAAEIERVGTRLKLNEFLQSVSNPAIYAAGDAAAAGPPLTPVASYDAEIVAANLLEGNRHRPDYRGIPSVAFTLPPIAMVGLDEETARARGLKFRVKAEKVSDWYTARRVAESVYGYKTLVEEDTGRILGAHLVGPHADEVINVFALAIRHELSAEKLKATIFAYPTGASDIGHML